MNAHVYLIMGVSGSGKSTIGCRLAEHLQLPYIEADDHHPMGNIDKMSRGRALSDEDRRPWLDSLRAAALEAIKENGAVISCSALKDSYRSRLLLNIAHLATIIYLKGSYESIWNRLKARDHFMPSSLLLSQYDILEEPKDALIIETDQTTPEQIIQQILDYIYSQVT